MASLILLPGLAGNEAMWPAPLAELPEPWRPVISQVHMAHDTIPGMAAALLAQHEGELVLCGASMGGMVAMEAARQAPGRIRGLALLGTTARPETDEMRRLREAAVVLFGQGRMAEVIEPNVALAFHPANARNAALVRRYLDFVFAAGSEQLVRQNQAVMARPDARPHLPALRCPVLVACGEADQLAPPDCSREIAALVPGAELTILPGCGHMLTMEQPQAVAALLVRWLNHAVTNP